MRIIKMRMMVIYLTSSRLILVGIAVIYMGNAVHTFKYYLLFVNMIMEFNIYVIKDFNG